MTVRIWHNPEFLTVQYNLNYNQPVVVRAGALKLFAIANTGDLNEAWVLSQTISQTWEQPWIKTLKPGRGTTSGDLMQTQNNDFWLIAHQIFLPLIQDPTSQCLIPGRLRRFQLDGLREIGETFTNCGFRWRIIRTLAYDLQGIQTTVIARQGPHIDE